MSESVTAGAKDHVQVELAALARWVLDLQGNVVHAQDPETAAQVYYLGALVQRAQMQPDPVRQLLVQKLAEKKQQFLEAAKAGGPVKVQGASTTAANPSARTLAALTHQLDQARSSASDGASPVATEVRRDLRSVSSARSTWAKLGAKKQLNQAISQAPKNAGPLNSHRVALQALALMQDLSPDYLSRFITYVDTLVALEAAQLPAPQRQRGGKPQSGGGKPRNGGRL
jgi:hypothetical protein